MKALKRICAGLIAGVLLVSSAAAAPVVKYDAVTAAADNKYDVVVSDASIIAGNEYALLIAKWAKPTTAPTVGGEVTTPSIDVNTLTYIDQKTAVADGTKGKVVFEDFIPKAVPDSVVLLGGVFNGKTSPIVIGYIDAKGVLVTGSVAYQTSSVNAIVKIYDANGNEIATGETSTNGVYSIDGVPTGEELSIVVSKRGYCTYTINNMIIDDALDLSEISIRNLAGDLDGDGYVNGYDLTYLLADFNKGGTDITMETGDLDGDGYVNGYDLTYLLSSFNNGNVVEDYSK